MKYICCLVFLGCLALSQNASAQDTPYTFEHETEGFFLTGLTAGGSFGSSGGGGYAGGEMSFAWLKEGIWGGFYTDAVYDFGQSATTLTVGPEFGFAVLGLDGGLGVRLGREEDPELGGAARGLVTLGNVSLYGRYSYWPDSVGAKHVGQVGVLLKLPLWTSGEERPLLP